MRFLVVSLLALVFGVFNALKAVETTASTAPVPAEADAAPGAAPEAEIPAQLVDRSIRYVSGKVLTLGDLVDHLQSNRPRQNPTTQAQVSTLWRDALERLTDDTLLASSAV